MHGGGLERVDGADAHSRDRELLERQREPADALQAGTHHGRICQHSNAALCLYTGSHLQASRQCSHGSRDQ